MIRHFKDLREVKEVTIEDDFELVSSLQKLKKDISRMKLGKEYTLVVDAGMKRTRTVSGRLKYKDRDIITIQAKHYAESFRVLDFFDNTIQLINRR